MAAIKMSDLGYKYQDALNLDKPPRKQKYKAHKVVVDGHVFDSKKEATRYDELKKLQKAGVVSFFLRQVPFEIQHNVKYKVDFLVFWKDGGVTWEDVKGFQTKEFKIKKKLVEERFPISITLI